LVDRATTRLVMDGRIQLGRLSRVHRGEVTAWHPDGTILGKFPTPAAAIIALKASRSQVRRAS